MDKSDDQYSPEETAQRFERAVKKSLTMQPQHHGFPTGKKKGATRKGRARKSKSRV
jgi:hypothetical protein